jgi:vancomycin resistance protein YoaR
MVGLGALGAWAAKRTMIPDGIVLPGVRIDGVPTDDPQATARTQVDAMLARRVSVRVGDVSFDSTLRDLGVRVDVDALANRAKAIGKTGDLLERWQATKDARDGKIDVPLHPSVDHAVLSRMLAPYKEAHDVQPISARLDLDHHTVAAEQYGRYLDLEGSDLFVLRAALDPKVNEVVLPVVTIAPRVNADFVRSLDVHVVISTFDTWFSRHGDQARRGKNIDVAASKLDGLVLSPNELVSFNAVVGDRSEDNGFEKSWEIYKGEMVEGVGGGTCQVASTLHAAAFFGGLQILERLPHSRPSAYITMGLDATVVYPSVDLKLKNPFDFPVVVHAKVDGNKLTMQILGPKKPVRVQFGRELLTTKPYDRKVEEDDKLTGTKVMLKQHGIRGYTIERLRTMYFEDGTSKIEKTKDTYPPTMEVYAVPTGFDVAQLPPLPEQKEDDDEETATPQPVAQVQPDSSVQLVEGPGAHAPTTDQAHPKKTLKLMR